MKKEKLTNFDFYAHVMKFLVRRAKKKKNWKLNNTDLNLVFGRDLKITDNTLRSDILKELERRGWIVCQRKLRYVIEKVDIPWVVRKKFSSV